ncbi:MAG TPA: hypothetical protein DCM87_17185, partial [Planctomycetes bacterium]|nr:hypothetical protein [Planctomycetota bacterium]
FVNQLTAAKIKANRQAVMYREIMRALGYVLRDDATSGEVLARFNAAVTAREYARAPGGPALVVWEGREETGVPGEGAAPRGKVIGYAFRVGGVGFWGPIEGVLALEPDLATVRGISFFKDEETPGLGHEINTDWFRDAFKGTKLRNAEGAVGFEFTARGKEPKAPNEVDAITGATETTNSVRAFLARNIEAFLEAARTHGIGTR